MRMTTTQNGFLLSLLQEEAIACVGACVKHCCFVSGRELSVGTHVGIGCHWTRVGARQTLGDAEGGVNSRFRFLLGNATWGKQPKQKKGKQTKAKEQVKKSPKN